jgi:hypothetical protein
MVSFPSSKSSSGDGLNYFILNIHAAKAAAQQKDE